MQTVQRQLSERCAGFTVLALVAGCASLVGCDAVVYVAHVAEGQFGILGDTEPIDDVLASGRLSEEDEDKLRLIAKARQFAVETIGLNAGSSYTTFYDTSGAPLAFNLSAAQRDALVPYIWFFPIVGEVPYLGFFDEDYLRRVEQDLIDAGYDTFTYEVDAYSTLGLFEDPVRSTMLRRNRVSLAETIIHELLHNTVWRTGDTTFNESLATFVGRQGAMEFLEEEYGDEADWPVLAVELYADTDAVNAFLLELYSDLEAHYTRPLTAEAKINGREAVYQAARDRFAEELLPTLVHPDWFDSYADLPTNNAWMLGHHRYNLDLAVFEAVYAAVDGDWPAALSVFHAVANAPKDPFDYLRNWLAENSG
jgi:predicted aminopeptidase